MSKNKILIGCAVLIVAVLGVVFAFTQGDKTSTGIPAREKPLQVGIIQNIKTLDAAVDGFKLGLTEAGYKEGVDIVYQYQSADGNIDKIKQIADEYIAQDVDLILTITPSPARVALERTRLAGKPIPIVFTHGVAVVESGLVESYKSSGNNLTGVVPDEPNLMAKKLEFLKQINPATKKVGVFYTSKQENPGTILVLKVMHEKAPSLGIEIVEYDLKTPASPESTVVMQRTADAIKPGEVDAILTIPDTAVNYKDNPDILIEIGRKLKIPILFITTPQVLKGGLFSYRQDDVAFGKQASVLADKIFRGTLPADIPLELANKYILVINLRVAKELGLTIPPSMLSIADQVIPADQPAP